MLNEPIAEKANQQQLLSEEMNDFISNKPHWIVRKGNTIFFLILIGLISISWMVQYPDVITAQMRIVAVNAPKLLIAKAEGKLERLLVENNEQVYAGESLAFLQSNGSHRQVIDLYKWIETIEPAVKNDSLQMLLKNNLAAHDTLGEVQAAYQDFENTLKETQQILATGFYQQKKNALQQDLLLMHEAQNTILKQKELTNKDFDLQKVEYAAKESLAKDKVIAPLEFNQDKSKLLSKQQSIEQFNAQVINNKMTIHNKEKEMLDLQKMITDQQQKFHTALFNLKSKLQEWMHQYIVTASATGKINFVGFLQEKQYIQINQELFYIIPPSNQFYGELRATQSGIGKIREGQNVIIRVNSFPSTEFGYLKGVVSYIPTLINADSSILIKVDFVNGMKTNYGKNILFKSNMNASAEVITDSRRLPDRLMGQLIEVLKR